MKTSAKFLLFGASVFLPAMGVVPLYAQHYRGVLPSSYQELRDYDSIGVKSDEQKAIEDLETRCETAEHALKEMQFNASIYDSHLMVNQIDDNRKVLNTALNKLYETEHRLTKAEETIDVLNLRLSVLEARSSKPKDPVRKPTPDFIPDSPAITPHPAIKKSDASKPKTPVNKPTPGKPTAPANNPTPAVK